MTNLIGALLLYTFTGLAIGAYLNHTTRHTPRLAHPHLASHTTHPPQPPTPTLTTMRTNPPPDIATLANIVREATGQ